MCPLASSRWCPTPDQLMILEEMYKVGVRTPSASQIQKITAQLSLYGKIEGKNVFYWFQNHKARDRQKLRRKLSKQLQLQQQILQQQVPVSSFLLDLSPSSTSIPPLAYCSNAPNYLPAANSCVNIPREGEHFMMLHNWKGSDTIDKEFTRTTKMYSGGWMMVEEDMDSPACRATRPVETLQLFPTTCTNLKEDRPGLPRLSCHYEATELN